MLAGVVALIGGGAGTFASFTAQVQNTGNTFATGTLFLHQTKGATTCTSESNGISVNQTDCGVLFTVSPGTTSQTVDLTMQNAGTVNAPTFTVSSPSCTPTTPTIATTDATNATNGSTTFTVSALSQALATGTPIKIAGDTTSYKVNADAAASATSLTVTPALAQDDLSKAITIDTSGFTGTNLCGQVDIAVAEATSSAFSAFSSCIYGGTGFDTSGCTGLNKPLTTFASTDSPVSLGAINAGVKRYFRVVVSEPSGGLTNAAQNELATFDLHWDISQT